MLLFGFCLSFCLSIDYVVEEDVPEMHKLAKLAFTTNVMSSFFSWEMDANWGYI